MTATTIKWTAQEAIQTHSSTNLNSLANSTNELTGKILEAAVIDNSADQYTFSDWELNLGTFSGTPSTGAYVEVFLLYSADGTNYCDGGTSVDPTASAQTVVFAIRANTAAQRIVVTGIQLFPGKFKVLIRNKTGQTFNATGNTLKYRRYNLQGV